ncbi:MAG: hypothetical protein EPO00_10565 [Chloroflexota bacterium]|nr:MAG: hypothetical protein EPO00_10565 [Chloroflexota bacterium]
MTGERFRANLARVADDAAALGERTAALTSFRASGDRRLSLALRADLAAVAGRYRKIADDLGSLAGEPDAIAAVLDAARRNGVPL